MAEVENPGAPAVSRAKPVRSNKTMKNWKEIAEAAELNLTDADIERIGPALNALEAAFRPLVAALAPEVEPALVFRAAEEAE
jgi:hypothetical protein